MWIGPFLTASQAPNGLLTDVGMVRNDFGNEPLKDVTMEMVRVEEFDESILFFSMDESILFFSRVSLSIFSLEALNISWVWGVFILVCVWNTMNQFFQNRAGWWLGLATWLRREFKPRTNWMASLDFLFYSASASMTLQLLSMLGMCATSGSLQAVSYQRRPVASPYYFAQTCAFLHTLSHTTFTWFPPKYGVTNC